VLGCRGGLGKMGGTLDDAGFRAMLLALRLAVVFHHGRRPIKPPRVAIEADDALHFAVPKRWLKAHPLSDLLLARERGEWAAAGHAWRSLQR
ncbi:MAG: Ppx/GppA family phosphatase, partial [Casimicrobiaceae bacterium]